MLLEGKVGGVWLDLESPRGSHITLLEEAPSEVYLNLRSLLPSVKLDNIYCDFSVDLRRI